VYTQGEFVRVFASAGARTISVLPPLLYIHTQVLSAYDANDAAAPLELTPGMCVEGGGGRERGVGGVGCVCVCVCVYVCARLCVVYISIHTYTYTYICTKYTLSYSPPPPLTQ
jgi:ABC-type glucose/galactose transport system permease subunit